MTDLRKAAEMALEVMEYNKAKGTPNMGAAIEALRQALAMEAFSEVNQEIEQALAQPSDSVEQEPVDWEAVAADQAMTIAMLKLEKREWVGLTNSEIHDTEGYEEDRKMFRFAKALLAKAKEKNTW